MQNNGISNAYATISTCKTYTFAMQNNESYNALVLGRLYKKYVMTKYLQPYGFLFAPEMNRSC